MSTQRPSCHDDLARMGAWIGTPPGLAVERFCSCFQPQLDHFSEVGVYVRSRRLSVVTLGCGAAFGREVARFLGSLGYDARAVADVVEIQRAIDAWMLVQLSAGGNGMADVDLAFRKRMGVEEAAELLAGRGLGAGEIAVLRRVARELGTEHTGLVAVCLSPGAPTCFRVYLHAHDRPGRHLGQALDDVLERVPVPAEAKARFTEHMAGLVDAGVSDAMVGPLLGAGAPLDSLKIEIFRVPLGRLGGMLEALSVGSCADLLRRAGADMQLETAEEVTLSFDASGVEAQVYFVPMSMSMCPVV